MAMVMEQFTSLATGNEAAIAARVVGVPPRASGPGGPAAPSPWLEAEARRVAGFVRLPEGWDSYQGRPATPRAATRAFELLVGLASSGCPPPAVIPTSPGGVQLEWHLDPLEVEVEIGPSGMATWLWERATGENHEGPLENPAPLVDLLESARQSSVPETVNEPGEWSAIAEASASAWMDENPY